MADLDLAGTVATGVVGQVVCHQCHRRHPAEFSHISQFGGARVYAVVCTVDWLTDYYTDEAVEFDA